MVNRPGRQERSKGKGGFSYKSPSAEDIKKRASQKGGKFETIFKNGFDAWRAQEGSNQIRILPPTWEDYDHYAYEVWVHRNIGSDNGTYLCLRKNKDPKTGKDMNKPCACCDLVRALKDDGETDDAKKVDVQRNFVCWILDRDENEEQPQLWQMGWMMDRDLAALCVNERTGKTLIIAHPDEGYDVIIKRTGKDIKTRYVPAIDREDSPIAEDSKTQREIYEFCQDNPVPSTLKFYSNDYLEQIVNGTTEEDDEELDKKKGRRRDDNDDAEDDEPKSKRRSRDEEEEDDEPKSRRSRDEEENEESEEDEKPRNKTTKSKHPADDEDDSSGEEYGRLSKRQRRERDEKDDEDAEEDKPRSRRSKSDDEDTEEDEEKPRSRRARGDDDDDKSDDDDDEVEDKPRKSSVKRRPVGKRR